VPGFVVGCSIGERGKGMGHNSCPITWLQHRIRSMSGQFHRHKACSSNGKDSSFCSKSRHARVSVVGLHMVACPSGYECIKFAFSDEAAIEEGVE